MVEPCSGVPESFRQGDTVKFYEELPTEFATADWVAVLRIASESGKDEFSGELDGVGGRWDWVISSTSTEELQGGTLYAYTIHVYNATTTDRHTLRQGTVRIIKDLNDGVEAHDALSHNRKVLLAIEAVLEKKATRDQQNQNVNGKSLTRYNYQDLTDLHDRYKHLVRDEERLERINQGKPGGGRIVRRS